TSVKDGDARCQVGGGFRRSQQVSRPAPTEPRLPWPSPLRLVRHWHQYLASPGAATYHRAAVSSRRRRRTSLWSNSLVTSFGRTPPPSLASTASLYTSTARRLVPTRPPSRSLARSPRRSVVPSTPHPFGSDAGPNSPS